jgi:hypothetical protein
MTDVTLVGSCMPEANDVRVASAVTAKRLGWLTQPKMFFYSATFALIATAYALTGDRTAAELLFVAACLCYVAAFVAYGRTKKILSDHILSGGERAFTLDSDGVSVSDADSNVRIGWTHYDAAFETPAHFVLRHCAIATTLPKRAFAEGDVGSVRSAIASRIPLLPLRSQ